MTLCKLFSTLGVLMMITLPLSSCAQGQAASTSAMQPAPAFTHTNADDWLNSPPLTWKDLKGQVVLVDVWTFDCWNCYRSIPWLKTVEAKYQDKGFGIIGVHSPELPRERVRANVVSKVAEYGIHYPVMIDNDLSYWSALGNQYWPAFYLVDKQGRIRERFIGETHVGDRNAEAVDKAVQALLMEK